MNTNSKNYKWLVLTCFAAAAGMSQFLWLNFAPILSFIQKHFGVSETEASLLLLVFPLIYVFLSIHAGALTDRKGYRWTLLFGTALMASFAWIRVYFGNFWLLLFAQVGIAVAQPYIVNAISKLVMDWFEKENEVLATGLGTVGMFVGMCLGMAMTPFMMESYGIEMTMAVFAVLACLVFVACYLWVKPNPQKSEQTTVVSSSFKKDCGKLLKNKELVIIFVISFMGLGYFNGLTTWLEGILAPHGMDSAQAGIVGGVLILGGIFGAILVPALSDLLKRRKPFLILCMSMGALTLWPLAMSTDYTLVLIFAAIQGFFFLPAYALLLEMAAENSGPELAGSATGILMLAGNAGAVIIIIAMVMVKGESATFDTGIYLLLGLLVLALALGFLLKESFHKKINIPK